MGFLSPAAFAFFPLAVALDAIGIVLVIFLIDDYGATDIIGLIFIGGWGYVHSMFLEKPSEVTVPPSESRTEIREVIAGLKGELKTGAKTTAETAKVAAEAAKAAAEAEKATAEAAKAAKAAAGAAKATKTAAGAAKWAKRMRWLRPLLIILKFIPYLGAIPLWTPLVWLELKSEG